MSRLRDRMTEDLRLRGRAQNTIDAYVRCVRKLIEWAGMPPRKIDALIVRAFLPQPPLSQVPSTAAGRVGRVAPTSDSATHSQSCSK